jgi:hypothetical protein
MNRNDTVEPTRDEWLGELLRELDVPEHRPEFHRELRQRLHDEQAAARRRTAARWSLRAVAVAAAATIALAVVGLPGTGNTPRIGGPEEASAAVVKAHVRAALATLRSLGGVLVATGPRANDTARWRFALDAAGDLRLEGPRAGDAIAYDAAAGVVRSAQHSASLGGDTLFYSERTGVAPGPPDQGPPTWVLPEQYGAFVRAALADSPSSVRATTYNGRPAWRLDVETAPNAIVPELSGDHLAITVDQATGMPVRLVESKRGATVRELRIEHLVVDSAVARSSFELAFPPGADVMRSDDGFRRVALDGVAAAVGYPPLVPAWVPDGYRLAEVAVARESGPTGKEGANPASRMVVSLSYRRGIDQFLVTTRLRGDGDWSDPLASPEGFVDSPHHLVLSEGALAGADAELVLSPHTTPHVWALTRTLVVTVGGDLDRDELTRVATSVHAR